LEKATGEAYQVAKERGAHLEGRMSRVIIKEKRKVLKEFLILEQWEN